MDKLKVGIIFGGCSEEHPVSVKSAQEVAKNLDTEKYEPFYIGITKSGAWKLCDGPGTDWENGSCRPAVLSPDRSAHGLLVLEQGQYETISLDLVLPVLHGKLGEDGAMQGLLELSGIPYVGCDVQSSALCMDKSLAYIVARSAGIATPNFWAVAADENIDPDGLTYPVFVKPARSGSSFGVSKVSREEELPSAVETARQYDSKVLIEEAVVGSEVGCAILGNGTDLSRRGRPDRAVSRFLQDPSGECSPRAAPKTLRSSFPLTSRRSRARSSRRRRRPSTAPWDAGAIAGRHVPQGRRRQSSSTRLTPCRPDLVQPLSENDGSRRVAARRRDRPDGVAGIDRKSR